MPSRLIAPLASRGSRAAVGGLFFLPSLEASPLPLRSPLQPPFPAPRAASLGRSPAQLACEGRLAVAREPLSLADLQPQPASPPPPPPPPSRPSPAAGVARLAQDRPPGFGRPAAPSLPSGLGRGASGLRRHRSLGAGLLLASQGLGASWVGGPTLCRKVERGGGCKECGGPLGHSRGVLGSSRAHQNKKPKHPGNGGCRRDQAGGLEAAHPGPDSAPPANTCSSPFPALWLTWEQQVSLAQSLKSDLLKSVGCTPACFRWAQKVFFWGGGGGRGWKTCNGASCLFCECVCVHERGCFLIAQPGETSNSHTNNCTTLFGDPPPPKFPLCSLIVGSDAPMQFGGSCFLHFRCSAKATVGGGLPSFLSFLSIMRWSDSADQHIIRMY